MLNFILNYFKTIASMGLFVKKYIGILFSYEIILRNCFKCAGKGSRHMPQRHDVSQSGQKTAFCWISHDTSSFRYVSLRAKRSNLSFLP